MASIQFTGTAANTCGELPEVGSKAPDFDLTKRDLSQARLGDFSGKKVVLNIFPSVDTGTCAQSVRSFNSLAARIKDAVVLCISRDLPFAQSRFCGAEGIDRVVMLSDYKDKGFGDDYGLRFKDGPFESLLTRAVVVIDEKGRVIYTEMVKNIGSEPDYEAALKALQHG
ncbi:thiol peroxidase (atypical 2-Cys peroxiredoxin) [Muriicola jejuensis]|uniref:Thiol peroxidase n=1 Tax=Muriicola jejuensis TaxID=504488 RepID=A0A6P0UDY8_9FLAO|nr:thiol peroxidase [Muriicola jejuensis]NER11425.1 thiol peroxidase [Muriicola jejuensis]SMP20853.1 thiol peroxidase (atypical 2-Cys peroxiredoxin) [Muriicola jejuensis]